MDSYLFLCVTAIAFTVHNVQAQQMGMVQNGGNMRRKFPGRQSQMGGGMGTNMNNQQGMNQGGGQMDPGMGGNNMGQGQGQSGGQGQGQGMNNNNMGGGHGGGMDMMGGGPMIGGMGMDPMMGGMNANMMMAGAMGNSEIPPHMLMSGSLNPVNFAQYRSCEKTPSSLNQICDPASPNPCPHGAMLSKSTPLGMGMGMGGGMNGGMNRMMGGNPLVCSRMTEHGLARCCAKNMMMARMLDKWFR